ncbi:hypothetical protein K435DRAFT_802129 [Dendrothele bispora CBS 962.96]|uniref:Uncharacterized protein n=1 Tax=Dendrothele bispora (strain CBS 962.96) TaxID=1314807 RepID=A0A4S8LND5_DENBC|nr:hypothetical protein K435DRAFT_802129 [Dendrothele bispora CBS 962.96]
MSQEPLLRRPLRLSNKKTGVEVWILSSKGATKTSQSASSSTSPGRAVATFDQLLLIVGKIRQVSATGLAVPAARGVEGAAIKNQQLFPHLPAGLNLLFLYGFLYALVGSVARFGEEAEGNGSGRPVLAGLSSFPANAGLPTASVSQLGPDAGAPPLTKVNVRFSAIRGFCSSTPVLFGFSFSLWVLLLKMSRPI